MKSERNNCLNPLGIIAPYLILLMLLPSAFAASLETYKFERLWPTLEQPWYFNHPCGIAMDSSGFVYIADTDNNRIQKFTSDGQFITKWGKKELRTENLTTLLE